MVTKITDYLIVTQQDPGMLTNDVKTRIAQGWQPIGGVTTCDLYYLSQALVKYEEVTAIKITPFKEPETLIPELADSDGTVEVDYPCVFCGSRRPKLSRETPEYTCETCNTTYKYWEEEKPPRSARSQEAFNVADGPDNTWNPSITTYQCVYCNAPLIPLTEEKPNATCKCGMHYQIGEIPTRVFDDNDKP